MHVLPSEWNPVCEAVAEVRRLSRVFMKINEVKKKMEACNNLDATETSVTLLNIQ